MRTLFAAAAVVALIGMTTGAEVLLGWLPPRRRRERLRLPQRVLRRKGLGYLIHGTGGALWAVGSLVSPDATVRLAFWALPIWIFGEVLVLTTLATGRARTPPTEVVDHGGANTLRAALLWLAVANLAIATAGLVLVEALLPHGIFKAWTAGFSIAAVLIDGMAFAGYAVRFRWESPFRRVQVSFVICGAVAEVTAFLAVGVSRAVPPPTFRTQGAVLAFVTLVTIGNIAWAWLMYRRALRDGGWKALNRTGSTGAR